MGILAAVVAAMGVVIALLVRLNSAADAARGLAETAGDAHGLFRRWTWRRKLAIDQLAMVDDARVAAGVMLVTAAQQDGALTQRELAWIGSQLQDTLGLSAKVADELLAHARFIAKDVRDLDTCLRRLTPLVQKSCGPAERADLTAMLRLVIALEHPPGDIEAQAVERFARVVAG
jgi:uncharacterized tellurite resistance protein B-like protein